MNDRDDIPRLLPRERFARRKMSAAELATDLARVRAEQISDPDYKFEVIGGAMELPARPAGDIAHLEHAVRLIRGVSTHDFDDDKIRDWLKIVAQEFVDHARALHHDYEPAKQNADLRRISKSLERISLVYARLEPEIKKELSNNISRSSPSVFANSRNQPLSLPVLFEKLADDPSDDACNPFLMIKAASDRTAQSLAGLRKGPGGMKEKLKGPPKRLLLRKIMSLIYDQMYPGLFKGTVSEEDFDPKSSKAVVKAVYEAMVRFVFTIDPRDCQEFWDEDEYTKSSFPGVKSIILIARCYHALSSRIADLRDSRNAGAG